MLVWKVESAIVENGKWKLKQRIESKSKKMKNQSRKSTSISLLCHKGHESRDLSFAFCSVCTSLFIVFCPTVHAHTLCRLCTSSAVAMSETPKLGESPDL